MHAELSALRWPPSSHEVTYEPGEKVLSGSTSMMSAAAVLRSSDALVVI